jgi:hypothetical protein
MPVGPGVEMAQLPPHDAGFEENVRQTFRRHGSGNQWLPYGSTAWSIFV